MKLHPIFISFVIFSVATAITFVSLFFIEPSFVTDLKKNSEGEFIKEMNLAAVIGLSFSIGIMVGIMFIIYEIQKHSKLFQFISPYISPKLNKKCPKIFCIKIKNEL